MKISIEGNIGCGKSSVITRLCASSRIPVFLEPLDEWAEWLDVFYQDPERWGMSFNLKVLMSYHKWKNNNFMAIYERSPLSCRYVFTQQQYDQGRMTQLEYNMVHDIYKELAWKPDVVIYIRADPNVCMERMQQRARNCESSVPLTYINDIHDKYEVMMATHFTLSKPENVFVVDGNKTADEVFEEVSRIITRFKHN
jgi:deoxyadenosine/deoxycytidine kinase